MERARLGLQIAAFAAFRALGLQPLRRHTFAQMPLLNALAEAPPHGMGPQFDLQVTRGPHDRPIGPFERHHGLGRFEQQSVDFFRQREDECIHAEPSHLD